MRPDFQRVFRYFSQFSYPPSKDELYSFLSKKLLKREFEAKLNLLVTKKKLRVGKGIVYPYIKTDKYTLGEYGIFINKNNRFSLYSKSKLKRTLLYFKLLNFFPQIQFAGLSGSISMLHADKGDDIDLFIITAKKRLWSGRLIANTIAFLLGLKRKRLVQQAKDKICLNLFFEKTDLTVPKVKRNEYIGHEILQVKPVLNKNNTYEMFLQANKWVFGLFPNAKTVFKNYIRPLPKHIKYSSHSLGDLFEVFFKRIQLPRIQKNKTTELITKHQLWFFPDDFEKKIMRYNRTAKSRSGGTGRRARFRSVFP